MVEDSRVGAGRSHARRGRQVGWFVQVVRQIAIETLRNDTRATNARRHPT